MIQNYLEIRRDKLEWGLPEAGKQERELLLNGHGVSARGDKVLKMAETVAQP